MTNMQYDNQLAKSLNAVLKEHCFTRENGRVASQSTMTTKGESLRTSFNDLHRLGYKLTDARNLTNKHVGALIKHWHESDKKLSTIQSRLSNLRIFAGWIGKGGMVTKISDYLPEVPKDQPLTIGVSGLGTTTHLFASQIQAQYPKLAVIPFKSTSESLLSVASGNTDLHVAFLGEVETWRAENNKTRRLNVLGISGQNQVRGFPTLTSQGFSRTVADIGVPFHLVVPASIPDAKFKEWRDILVQAGKSDKVKETYKLDVCVPYKLSNENLEPWYRAQVLKWQRLSHGVKLEK